MGNGILQKKRAFIGVYGCQMNISDAERMEGQLATLGYERTEDMARADLILLNTCCVRETAEDKVYGKIGEIKHIKRANPALIFGITGCMAQKEGEALIRRAPHIDFVLGTNKVHELKATVRQLESARRGPVVDVLLGDAPLPENVPIERTGRLSAWVPIMYGCNNFCTYCIVPYVRGREHSRRPEDVVREVEEAAAQGFKEITLLGQNVNSYGRDHKLASFAELLLMVDAVKGVERVRYMTSHPKDLSDAVIDAVRQGRHICPHFHLPVQHGSDRILRAMNRVYRKDAYRSLVERIRAAVPDASLTTDLIVGFPGETEEDFGELLDFLREIRYDAAYTFLYSKRSGTPAATMEAQVEDSVKKERLHRLMEVQNEISLEKNAALKGTVQEVLAEGPSRTDEDVWTGRTGTNKIVLWRKKGQETEGDIVRVRITQPQTWVLKGELQ
ncbi:tRNA (N6-isopentenyl adenosine(37)-C2)-methylthiotransferase MiaB [Selenomonas sputigena]|uniref:tRNA-2-methylthio-N(6)-dimethylallyladenosine synthase n=1 Tax=Selenomonas sputigena (strain ATCC 35185 / DSM 20758 / CCUG 44933 / VPI D19B-28) TaxID=546271 RepID=C9LUL1_SELS3|nr:tRNA (N6-isopentenyl adenosine(37)-C2)-methylthiotransferase MiaB [Selenomonas sputigena]AEC00059.1 RNA modification enzyme, MiaB family [Selenomonas sputigena ATCC 35185]EEX77444.1 tRNA-i(6)A37 thiotransferase enzyme MiaB [Selenomonas sputigena ATCC 35185]